MSDVPSTELARHRPDSRPAPTAGARPPWPGWLRLPTQPLLRHVGIAVVAGAALFLLSDNISAFRDSQLTSVAIFTIALGGLTLLTGLNGQLSLGHGALMAIGAYSTAMLFKHTSLPLGVVIVLSIAITALAGVAIGAAAARLRGPYLAGATLALAVALPELATKYASVFGGEQGLTVNPLTPPASLGVNFTPERWLSWIAILCALVTLVLLANLITSRVGRTFRAVRDDEIAASLAGLHVARTQVLAFVISSACAGLAGCLFALNLNLAAPAEFPLALSIQLLTGIVIGGLGSLAGSVWGAIILVYLGTEITNFAKGANLSGAIGANLSIAIYGGLLIVVMLAFPEGIQGALRRLGKRLFRVR